MAEARTDKRVIVEKYRRYDGDTKYRVVSVRFREVVDDNHGLGYGPDEAGAALRVAGFARSVADGGCR